MIPATEDNVFQEYNKNFEKYLFWIRKSAKLIVFKFNNQVFLVDELINEAWIRGIKSNRQTKSEFVQRAYWDMKDYVREIIGREESKNKLRFLTNQHTDEKGQELSTFDKCVDNEDIKRIDNRELLGNLLKVSGEDNRRLINSYYFEEKSLKEIGKENNRAESTTCTRLKKAINEIQENPEIEQYACCEI
jgi:RNA polymerase sigma factor (sigma-70 family)